jgi:hypothetical protein
MEAAGIKSKYEAKEEDVKEAKDFECPLCCETFPIKDTFSLDCGHRHCMGCWKVGLRSFLSPLPVFSLVAYL